MVLGHQLLLIKATTSTAKFSQSGLERSICYVQVLSRSSLCGCCSDCRPPSCQETSTSPCSTSSLLMLYRLVDISPLPEPVKVFRKTGALISMIQDIVPWLSYTPCMDLWMPCTIAMRICLWQLWAMTQSRWEIANSTNSSNSSQKMSAICIYSNVPILELSFARLLLTLSTWQVTLRSSCLKRAGHSWIEDPSSSFPSSNIGWRKPVR